MLDHCLRDALKRCCTDPGDTRNALHLDAAGLATSSAQPSVAQDAPEDEHTRNHSLEDLDTWAIDISFEDDLWSNLTNVDTFPLPTDPMLGLEDFERYILS